MSSHVFLFGPPRIAHGDGTVALIFNRRHQLLAYLALRRGGAAQRTELTALLWPEAPPTQAAANLRKTLFRMRELPWASAIAVRDQSLAFDGSSDVADFETAIAQQRWADALQIAALPLLDGYDDDASEPWSSWLRAERMRLRTAWRTAAAHLLAAAADPADALTLSSRLLADDPLDESALRAHMLAHAQQGHPARARNAYRAYAEQLARELAAAPSAELQALNKDLGAAAATAPSPSAADGAPGLIGRNAERRIVRARLEANCRLVCLTGPGGVGKSSLAQQLLAELAVHYPEGSSFVPLDDVPSPDALGARLARELAVPVVGDDALQAVIAFLRERRVLLVLDNFEHLQGAAPQLHSLLQACQRVQLLVTSRARLGLAGEQLVPLDGLPCPGPEDTDCLNAFDAVQLFVRAAHAVDPTLQPAAEAAAIIDICRLVDGLPLALEIAAGWTRVLSCSAVAAELKQGIALLLEADTARPARHKSMAAVFEQSWRRLSPVERSTWARMTVFHGGFTPEAARAVTGATLPVLASFADQSLLRKAGSRVDLHPLLRQLVGTHLTDDERDAAAAAHMVYYLGWLGALMDDLQRGDKQALQQVDVELENVRAAWRWACRQGRTDALQGAVLALVRFCELNGRNQDGLALMQQAAQAIGTSDARLGPLLDAAVAHVEMRRERHAEAQARAKRALLATRETRDRDTRLICYRTLGTCALETGRLHIARRRYRQALALAAPDPYHTAAMLQNLAIVEKELGHYDAARPALMRALAEHRSIGNAVGEAWGLSNLAALEMDAGQFDTAAAHLDASLALSERHALAIIQMLALLNLTDLAVRRNDAAAAQHHGQRALELADQIGARGEQMLVQLHLAQLGVQQRDLPAARALLRAAAEHAIGLDHRPTQLDCVLCFANLVHVQGEANAALGLLRYAIGHPATARAARDRAGKRLAEWSRSQPDADAPPAPAIDLCTLLHRIVAETPAAHASLIASLPGGSVGVAER